MQRALELSLRDMSTEEGATYSTDRDAMVTSDAAEEDEVRKRSGEEGVERAREKERERERERERKTESQKRGRESSHNDVVYIDVCVRVRT